MANIKTILILFISNFAFYLSRPDKKIINTVTTRSTDNSYTPKHSVTSFERPNVRNNVQNTANTANFLSRTMDVSQFQPEYVEDKVASGYSRTQRSLNQQNIVENIDPLNDSVIPLYTTQYQPERSLLWHMSFGDSLNGDGAMDDRRYGMDLNQAFEQQIPKFIQLYRFRNEAKMANLANLKRFG